MNIVEKVIFDDTDAVKSITNLIDKIESLDSSFDITKKEVTKSGENMSKAIVAANNRAIDSTKQVVKANISLAANKKDILDLTLTIGKHGEQAEKLVGVYKKLEAAKAAGIILDDNDVDDLSDGFKKLADTVGLSEKQLTLLQSNLGDVASELDKFINNDGFSNLGNEAEQVTKKFASAKSELRALTNLINSGKLDGAELETAVKRAAELTDEIGDTRSQIAKLASDTRSLDLVVESVTAIGAGFQIAEGAAALFGDESEDMQKALVKLNAVMALSQGLQQAMEVVTTRGGIASKVAAAWQLVYATAVGTSTGALKIFRIALLATGVGALVVGLGLLISNFDKVKKALGETFPFFNRLGSVASGVIDGIVAGFSTLSSVVSKVFAGDFSGAYADAKKLGSNIAAAYNQGVAEADTQAANEALAKQITDIVDGQKRRLAILEAGGKETYALQKNILSNEIKALKLAGAEKKDIQDKELELDVLVASKQKEIYEKAKQIRKKAVGDFAKIKDDLFKLSSEFKVISEAEQFEIIKEKQLETLAKAKNDLIDLGKILNKDVSKDVRNFDLLMEGVAARDFTSTLTPIQELGKVTSAEIKALQAKLLELENVQINFGVDTSLAKENVQKEIDKLSNEGLKSGAPIVLTIPTPTIVTAGALKLDIGSDLEIFLGDVNNFEDLLRKGLSEAFGSVGGEIAGDALKSLGSFVGELNNIAGEADQIRLDMLDKQLESLAERRKELEDGLAEELEDQEAGLANNVSIKQAEVDAIIAEEARLKSEQERIKQESAKRQLAIETATQAASLITTSIEIFKGFAGIPFGLGIPLAIAAVAGLFGFFAKTKIDAFKATKLYTGTGDGQIKDFFGFANKSGESDLPGRGQGYRLYDERTKTPTNVIVSGKEMMLPENVSLPNAEFFASLRAGQYSGIDLNEAVGYFKRFKNIGAIQTTTKVIKVPQNAPNKTRIRQAIPFVDREGVTKAVIITINDTLADGSIIEIDM